MPKFITVKQNGNLVKQNGKMENWKMRKLVNFRLSEDTINKLSIIKEKRKFASAVFTVETLIKEAYDSLDNEEPEGIELLKPVLGEELYQQHIAYLQENQGENETLEDVLRALVSEQFIYPTKEQFFKRVKEKAVTRFKSLMEKMENCYYRTIAEDETWYCDGKKIPPEVCLDRQKRYRSMDRRCKPKTLKRKPFTKSSHNPKALYPQKEPSLQTFRCELIGETFKYEKFEELANKLPCLEDPMETCKATKCHNHILELIGKKP